MGPAIRNTRFPCSISFNTSFPTFSLILFDYTLVIFFSFNFFTLEISYSYRSILNRNPLFVQTNYFLILDGKSKWNPRFGWGWKMTSNREGVTIKDRVWPVAYMLYSLTYTVWYCIIDTAYCASYRYILWICIFNRLEKLHRLFEGFICQNFYVSLENLIKKFYLKKPTLLLVIGFPGHSDIE